MSMPVLSAAAAAPSPITTTQYLALLHPPGSRGNAFLSGPAAGETGGDYRWRDQRCAADRLAGAGERFAAGREGKYVSMARYANDWRREEALAEVGALWVDVDVYGYARQDPLVLTDDTELAPTDRVYGLPKPFWHWYHRCWKQPGDPALTCPEGTPLETGSRPSLTGETVPPANPVLDPDTIPVYYGAKNCPYIEAPYLNLIENERILWKPVV